MTRLQPAAALLAALIAGPSAAATPNMKPGLWETTIRTEMAGTPMEMPPVTQRQCFREEDLVPRVEGSDQNCRLVDQEIDGDTVTWRIQCEGGDMPMSGSGRLVYAGDSYRGRIDIHAEDGPMGPMTMTQKLQGQRVGDCP